ncbi:hypothetical protein FA15DRAFT_665826 [Coprinopsis marcescibilis]|uniref:ABM domain-containing protein n=1 Tax=Coprinopsis marcescibilis TaxID=230819 RepID=A0A5C3LHQ1_COPMA|nr:hypothetical protein FA15DRAFT_665826 [Coprinopsis marcescibilis]
MSNLLQLISFPATQAFKENPTVIAPALSVFSKDNTSGVFFGKQFEDQNKGYVAIVWKGLAIESDAFAKFSEDAKDIISQSQATTYHIVADGDPIESLKAPATEFAFAKLRKEENREPLIDTVKELYAHFATVQGNYGPVYGTVEKVNEDNSKERDLVAVVGWDSPQRHGETAKGLPGIAKLVELSQLTVFHVAFTQSD